MLLSVPISRLWMLCMLKRAREKSQSCMEWQSLLSAAGSQDIGEIRDSKSQPQKNDCRTTTYHLKQRGVQMAHFKMENMGKPINSTFFGLLRGFKKWFIFGQEEGPFSKNEPIRQFSGERR